MTAPVPETTAPEPRRAGRLGWRRVIFGGLLGLVGGAGIVHLVGGTMSLLVAGGSAAAGVAGYGVYKYPHIRRHYEGPWLARRHARREGKGRKGFSEAWQRNWRKGFKSPGNPLRNVKNPFRKTPGSPFRGQLGRKGTRPGGLGARLRRGTGAMFRRKGSAGTGRRARAGSGSRSRALRRSGTGQGRRAGIFRRPGKGSGGSRRGSGAFRRFRRGPGTSGGPRRRTAPIGRTRRRTPVHPFGGRRTAPRTPRPGRSRSRSFRHPLGGRRTAPRAAPAGRSRRRTPVHPFGGRLRGKRGKYRSFRHPSTWRKPHRPGWTPGRARRGWYRMFGTPSSPRLARRGWHRMFGTPAVRASRRRAAKARRANARNRRRRARGTYGRRARWYAPWRGRLQLRHRIGNRIGNWRARRLRYRGLRAVTGRTPLRLRMRHWLGRRTWAGRWARMRRRLSPSRWRRNRRMPRALLGGRHRAGSATAGLQRFYRTPLGRWIARRDRRRRQQWAARQSRGRPTSVPGTPVRPVTPAAAGGNGHRPAGSTTGGGKMSSSVDAAAEQIEEAGGWEASDPQDVHDTIAALPRIPEAVQVMFTNIASRLEEHPNIDPATVEVINEFAGAMNGMADQLRQKLQAGVMPG